MNVQAITRARPTTPAINVKLDLKLEPVEIAPSPNLAFVPLHPVR